MMILKKKDSRGQGVKDSSVVKDSGIKIFHSTTGTLESWNPFNNKSFNLKEKSICH
jgi:hypothetical protein